MQIQTLDIAQRKTTKHFIKNRNASISALFRNLRTHSCLTFFGDYPIIATIVNTMTDMEIYVKKPLLRYALLQSDELKGQRIIFNELLSYQMLARNSAQMPDKPLKVTKSTTSSLKGASLYE